MSFIKNNLIIILITIFLFNPVLKAEEEEVLLQAITDQIKVLSKDLKTIEKAVYQKSDISSSSNASSTLSSGLNEDILTKHLLKLNEIEDQFRELTNKFEEVNFKLDKLSSRVTKIQSDSQLRFSDIENLNLNNKKIKTNLPGSSKPKDFGANPGYSVSNLPERQEINSIEGAQTVITESPENKKSLLPDKKQQNLL